MKKELLTVKELAAELRMSVKSIQRAYRKDEIPVKWLGRMARFDLAKSIGRWIGTDEVACVVSTATRHSGVRPAARAAGAPSRTAPARYNGGGISRVPHGGFHECMDMFARMVSFHRA